jgi:hypothetical protein
MKIVTVKNKAKYVRLYALAEAIKAIKPWQFLYEDQLFAVVLDKNEVFFCSIMGKNKEVYAMAMYEGFDSFMHFVKMASGSPMDPFAFLIEQKTTMLYFELLKDLENEDKAILTALGYEQKPRVRYPQFRDMTPLYVPCPLPDDRLDITITVLEQALFMLEEASKEPQNSVLRNSERLAEYIPAAVGTLNENGQYEWKYDLVSPDEWDDDEEWDEDDEWDDDDEEWDDDDDDDDDNWEEDEKVEEAIVIPLHYASKIAAIKKLPQGEDGIFITTLVIPAPVKEKNDKRAYYPSLIIGFDTETNEIIDDPISMIDNLCSPKELRQYIEKYFFDTIERLEIIPSDIYINQSKLYEILKPYCTTLHIEISLVEDDESTTTMLNMLRQMFFNMNR